MPIKAEVTDVSQPLNYLVKKSDYGMSEGNGVLMLKIFTYGEKKTLNSEALMTLQQKTLTKFNIKAKPFNTEISERCMHLF